MRLAAAIVALSALGCGDSPPASPGEHRLRVDAAMVPLERMYLPEIGRFGFRWWNSASALETVLDYSAKTGSTEYLFMVGNTFDRNGQDDFLNDYYDDEAWWALAWIKAHDLTGEARYLEAAELIFEDIAASWDEVCSGGVWWRRARDYKNAITNELFLQLAVRLYRRTDDPSYLDWAQRSWAWFDASGMINADGLINDGLSADCTNNGQTPWTYNQGVILGGLAELSEVTAEPSHLARAESIAEAAIATLVTADGVLTESCEPECGDDGPQFKGIFMRNLSRLYDASPKPAYRDFILRNTASIWLGARSEQDELGLTWSGPFDVAGPSRQSSALDALNAALRFDE